MAGIVAGAMALTRFEWVRVIDLASRGVVSAEFIAIMAAVVITLAVILLLGRIRLDDLAFNPDYAARGIAIAVMIWSAAQVIGVIPRVVANRPVLLDPAFEYGSRWAMAGDLLTALARATLEETVFRGFLFIQLYLLLARQAVRLQNRIPLAASGVALASILVALPQGISLQVTQQASLHLGIIVAFSLFLTWIFFRTRNIFFTIGVHALLLAPTSIVAGPHSGGRWFAPLVIAILAGVWALLWPRRD
ncbi:MAG: CPBP family glutamic-type intramembrane protease [Gemmatimonadota bacterium]